MAPERALAQGAGFLFVLNDDTEIAPDCVALLVEAAVRVTSSRSPR